MNTEIQSESLDVSVVIPTNRIDSWLVLSVESILKQQGITFELILYLDGVVLPAESTWQDDPRIRIVKGERSQGVGFALKSACERATGRYIARLDSDDIALPDRLRTQAHYLDEHPDTVAVSGLAAWVNDAGERIGEFGHKPGHDVRRKLLEQNAVVQSAVMFRRDVYVEVGGYSTMRQMEDYDLWLRLAMRGKIATLDEMVVEYRIHDNQVSRGVHPRGPYLKAVFRGRRTLASQLGATRISQAARDVAFDTALYMMYYLPPSMIRRIRTLVSK